MSETQYIIVTVTFKREDDGRWTVRCNELGTSMFGDTFEEADEAIREAIGLHLNALEEVGEREKFFREHNIKLIRKAVPRYRKITSPIDPNIVTQSIAQPIYA
ncbi:type II toxin-antitoxin system HicB family antitoxin [bacterium]|nr:type II toxin-antitoxin system HicB family antitoxin [bacterium]